MPSKANTIWTLKELTECLRKRQLNKFDVNIGVSGKRGDGKSVLLFKIFNSFKNLGFNPKIHQEYSRDKIIKLLATQKFGYCWDDEAINSGYKRDFQNKGQKELIKIVTNYRDNFNIHGSALPFFYSLDVDLRELMFLHIHVIQRGVAVILMPIDGSVHSKDPWDTYNNQKIETQENKRLEKNSDAKFRYHRFTTFAGYLYFGDMTKRQKKVYEKIKHEKRALVFNINDDKPQVLDFNEKIYRALIEGRLSQDTLKEMCDMEGKKYSAVSGTINTRLRDERNDKRIKDFFALKKNKAINSKTQDGISNLVPDFSP